MLELRLEDGWKPLCEFLEKETPNTPFPVKNKRGEHVKRVRQKQNMFFKHVAARFAKNAIPYGMGAGVIGFIAWRSRSGVQWATMLCTVKQALAQAW